MIDEHERAACTLCLWLRANILARNIFTPKLKHSNRNLNCLIGDYVERTTHIDTNRLKIFRCFCLFANWSRALSVSVIPQAIAAVYSIGSLLIDSLFIHRHTYYCKMRYRHSTVGARSFLLLDFSDARCGVSRSSNDRGALILISNMKITSQSRHIRQCKY